MLEDLSIFTIDNIQKWATLVGSVAGIIALAWNLLAKFRENVDKIKISFGSLEPVIEPGNWLHVLSQSDHAMFLKDYGFIDEAGRLLSLPQLCSDEPGSDEFTFVRGKSSFEKRGDLFEIGPFQLRDQQIGAFAITAGQKHYVTGFRSDILWYKRLWVNFKIRWKPVYQL